MELLELSNKNDDRKNVLKCGICGDPHFYRHCKYVVLTSKISNKDIPSRARLSLPDNLQIKKLADESYSVFTKTVVEVGTEFGPFVAKRNLSLNPSAAFPIKIFIEQESDFSEYYLDTMDENECCWMMFVNPASDVEEQNLICYQEGDEVFFGAIKDINPGEELKVWYSPYYAFRMQKSTLSFKVSAKLQVESDLNKNNTEDLNTLIKEQQKIVPRVIWNCKFCYKLEKNVTDFARHLMSHYSLQKRKICQHCQQRFRFIQDYRKHLKLFHNDHDDSKDKPVKYLHATNKNDEKLCKKPQTESKNNMIGDPLLLQMFNDSLDNSNLLIQQPEINFFDLENYENQNILLDSEHLRLNVDVIGSHNLKDFEDTDNKTKEGEKQEFICDICLKRFTTLRAIYLHLRLHVGKYYCSACKKIFGRPESLKQHKCNQIYSFKCPNCEKIFYQKKYLTKHISIVHEKKFSCVSCSKFYHSAADLRNHACDKVPKEKLQKFMCNICSKSFVKEKYLKLHLKKHSISKENSHPDKHICNLCSFICSSKTIYTRHLASVHNKSWCYDCHICDKKFSRKDNLKCHMITVHMLGPANALKCTKCNKEFKSKGSLNSHMRSTHNDSQYSCDCGATFKYSRNLVRHIKSSHKLNLDIGNQEMHECPICAIKVKLKRSLQRHIRKKHPGEYKNICLELNNRKEQQKKIIEKCPVCSFEVKSVVSLKRHILKEHPKDYKNICTDLSHTKDTTEKVKKDTKIFDDDFDNNIDTDQKCMDLQKTIENMDFNIDICNDNLLSGSETIDKFLKESSEQISVLFADSPKAVSANDTEPTLITDRISNREVCLSMPDLCEMEQEIKLGKHAYISETGNIVEPQEDSSNVVVYILNASKKIDQ